MSQNTVPLGQNIDKPNWWLFKGEPGELYSAENLVKALRAVLGDDAASMLRGRRDWNKLLTDLRWGRRFDDPAVRDLIESLQQQGATPSEIAAFWDAVLQSILDVRSLIGSGSLPYSGPYGPPGSQAPAWIDMLQRDARFFTDPNSPPMRN